MKFYENISGFLLLEKILRVKPSEE